MSVIVSNKKITKGHAKRIKFVKRLKEHFGKNLDVFGAGNEKLEDKWDGIAPYKYFIALENSSFPDYWTEKLSDAFLGGAYPLYYGCPNIHDYFSKDSLTLIDINNVSRAIETISRTIEACTYERSIKNIEIAKNLVLNKYNLFAIIADYCVRNQSHNSKTSVTVFPENIAGKNRMTQRMKYIIKRILHKSRIGNNR
jgi:hypothetical protein